MKLANVLAHTLLKERKTLIILVELLPICDVQNWKFQDPSCTCWSFDFPQGMVSLAVTCPFVAVLVLCFIIDTCNLWNWFSTSWHLKTVTWKLKLCVMEGLPKIITSANALDTLKKTHPLNSLIYSAVGPMFFCLKSAAFFLGFITILIGGKTTFKACLNNLL